MWKAYFFAILYSQFKRMGSDAILAKMFSSPAFIKAVTLKNLCFFFAFVVVRLALGCLFGKQEKLFTNDGLAFTV
jgi:hypothetical protein